MENDVFVLDSNIWISYLITGRFHILIENILELNIDVVTCNQLIDEISNVLQRKKFIKYITKRQIKEAIAIHIKLCRFVEVIDEPDLLSDKKDNFLIALYKVGHATKLVTGDKKLLLEAPNHEVNVMSLEVFREQIEPLA
jgi:putative PIN family toxin of toxin-antitoxin system